MIKFSVPNFLAHIRITVACRLDLRVQILALDRDPIVVTLKASVVTGFDGVLVFQSLKILHFVIELGLLERQVQASSLD